MIDAELSQQPSDYSPVSVLLGLLSHKFVENFLYADNGPPTDIVRNDLGWEDEVAPGWIEVFKRSPSFLSTHSVQREFGGNVTRSSMWASDVLGLAKADDKCSAYLSASSDDAATMREADALAAQAARSAGVDLYITNRDYLFNATWPIAKSVTFLRPDDALPLISLYLRTQGDFRVQSGLGGALNYNRGLFYWVGTRELLPAAWRWFGAFVQADFETPEAPLTVLSQSALQRVDRALRLRDDVHRAMNQPQDNDIADDALLAFDSCLVFLMGSIDAVARAAHMVLGLTSSPRSAGWQRRSWLKELRHECPGLASIVDSGTPGRNILELVTTLRNTVHSAGLEPIAITTSVGGSERTLIKLSSGMSKEERAQLDTLLAALGGREAWGVDRRLPDRILADPGVVLDQIFPKVLSLLNDLMDATPVERLPNVALSDDDCKPPINEDDVFTERHRLSIRWQLGL